MKPEMNDTEKRELDAWIAENVIGYSKCSHPDCTGWHSPDTGSVRELPRYTEGESFQQLLEKCVEKARKTVCFCIWEKGFEVYLGGSLYISTRQSAETIPLALAKFAKEIFKK